VDWNNALQLVSIRTTPQYAANPLPAPAYNPPAPGYNPPAPGYNPPAYNPPAAANPVNNPNSPLYIPPRQNPVNDPNSPLYIPPAQQPDRTQVADYRVISVPEGVVVPVSFDQTISSATARVGQTFTVSTISRRMGDSEFPPGTKLEGIIMEAVPRENNQPGTLEFEFRNAILPDGTRIPLDGSLISLDEKSVQVQDGRIEAKGPKKNNDLKVIGIGAAGGWVIGELLNTNKTVTTILGAAGGYLVGRSQNRRAEEATVKAGSTVGVRLNDQVQYRDVSDYSNFRSRYLRTGAARFDARDYGFDPTVAGPTSREDRYDGYDAYDTTPPISVGNVYDPNSPNYIPPVNTNPYPGRYDNPTLAQQISVPEGVVVPVTMDQELSSATARVGQLFTATVESRQMGDSEFPAGTKIRGRVLAVTPRQGDDPGTLEFEFRNVIFPDGSRTPIRGSLISLDDKSVNVSDGRITAKAGKSNGVNLKVIGIGAGAGFVVGRLLKKDGILPAVIGALGGYLYGRSQNDKPAEAVVPAGTRLGVRLDNAVTYADSTGYRQYRTRYLRQP
jgi:hypothetical protein